MAYQVTCLLSASLDKADVPFFFFPDALDLDKDTPVFHQQ